MEHSILEVNNISKTFDGNQGVLSGVNFSLSKKEIIAVLGPSGSGKSTLLRLIAGLESLDSGTITLNDLDVSGLAPHKRGIGLMFQDLSLFPHLNVFDNIAFGLRMDNWRKPDIKNRVEDLLSFLRISHLNSRSTDTLSGGESQRVALARALAPNPPVLMLDEPLGSLDRKLRYELLREMKDLFRSMELSVLYVTHDQEEAFTIGDRIILLNDGLIEQMGTPIQMISRPATKFVADFLGTPNMFSVQPKYINNKLVIDSFFGRWELPVGKFDIDNLKSEHTLIISPYSIVLNDETNDSLRGEIQEVSVGPGYFEYRILVDNEYILISRENIVTVTQEFEVGDYTNLHIKLDETELLPW
ncbi:MAG: ABC transporter ATP-binding protein [Dehalococcoidia bacterium]